MRFFFPDSQDQVDPYFDFVSEEHPVHRVRQRDDKYAHEVLTDRPFDGLLVSKAIVDGTGGFSAGKYSAAARNRLYREGIRQFFRLTGQHEDVVTMGDCGAFTYIAEEKPPYTVEEVADFYDHCGFDLGVAPDHIVFGFVRAGDPPPADKVPEWERRRRLTIDLAEQFWQEVHDRQCHFEAIGVAHGWSAATYAQSVSELQDLGYRRIAMGGMVPLKTRDILATLDQVAPELKPDTELHLLGITRLEEMATFAGRGVTSFDSTSPFRQAFKDDKDNYYALDTTYIALRVPQVDGNAALKRAIQSGQINQRSAITAERRCLEALRAFDAGRETIEGALDALENYSVLTGEKKSKREDYRRTLEAAAWKRCTCGICAQVGIDVMIFRGSERNKRRGFHNLAVFRHRLNRNGFPSLQSARSEL